MRSKRSSVILAATFAISSCRRGAPGAAVDAGAAAAAASVVATTADAGDKTQAGTSASASVSASAPDAAAGADTALRVVAEAHELAQLLPLSDGRILLLARPFLYEARADGTLEPVTSREAYGAVLPDDESLVGYGKGTPWLFSVASDREGIVAWYDDRIFRVGADALTPVASRGVGDPISWRGRIVGLGLGSDRKLAWFDAPLPSAARPSVDDGQLPAFPGIVTSLATDGAGGLVVLGRAERWKTMHIEKPGAPPAIIDVPPEGCAEFGFLRSFDRDVYLRCMAPAGSGPQRRYLKLVDGAWKPAFARAPGGAASVAPDGALWAARPGGAELMRCSGDDLCTVIPHDAIALTAGVPHYEGSNEQVLSGEASRTWNTLSIVTSQKVAASHIEQIVARGAGDVWVISGGPGGRAVLHTGTRAEARLLLPAQADARVLVRNTKPPTRWVGHCNQLFVRLGPARDAEAIAKRAPQVRAIVKKAQGGSDDALSHRIVSGRLHEDDVVGVVLWRDVEAPESMLERAANAIVEAFAADPIARPPVYCTLPVLERVFASP